MHYNTALLSALAAGTSLISTSAAAPLQSRQYTPQCPAGTSYVNYESTSGFKGCTATPDAYKYGPRVYWGSCPPAHGNWYVCASGFSGCTTDSTICDPKSAGTPTPPVQPPVQPPVNPGECPAGQTYYNCATGFKGCSADPTVCDPPKPKPEGPGKPDDTYCPAGQTYYNCATGFKGCSADPTVCDPPKPKPEYPVDTPVSPPTGLPAGDYSFCPKGTSYVDFTSTSGFKGCTATTDNYAYGERKYWSSCPPSHGNWYVCANGFTGCNTYTAVCDLKVGQSVPI